MSIINELSFYPNGIDPLLFFQDNGIEHIEELKHYHNLIKAGHCTDANSYADFQSHLYMYSASLFNCLENRILELQKHLLTKEKINPMIVSTNPPENAKKNTVWVNEIVQEELLDHNYYFQNNEPSGSNLNEDEDVWINVEDNETYISKNTLTGNTDIDEPSSAILNMIWIGKEK